MSFVLGLTTRFFGRVLTFLKNQDGQVRFGTQVVSKQF